MTNVVRTRVRERGPLQATLSNRVFKAEEDWRDRAFKRAIIILGDEQEWEQNKQAKVKWFLNRDADDKMPGVLRDWHVFMQDIKTHSGAHRHQGGLVIYVIEGEGYTEVDGIKNEWEAGDVLLLPLKPGGCVHKHFNKHPGQSAVWIAFIYMPPMDELGKYCEQKELSPDFNPNG